MVWLPLLCATFWRFSLHVTSTCLPQVASCWANLVHGGHTSSWTSWLRPAFDAATKDFADRSFLTHSRSNGFDIAIGSVLDPFLYPGSVRVEVVWECVLDGLLYCFGGLFLIFAPYFLRDRAMKLRKKTWIGFRFQNWVARCQLWAGARDWGHPFQPSNSRAWQNVWVGFCSAP